MDDLIRETFNNYEFRFKKRPGVFSRSGIDDGTRLLINNLSVRNKTLICDLGCGSGVIGFICGRLNRDGHVHLLENNVRAYNLAQENFELNRSKNVEVFLSDLFSAVPDRTYHQIYSNPPQQLGNDFLDELAKECFDHLKPRGEVFLVVKKNLKQVVQRYLEKYFKNGNVVDQNKSYVVLKAIKND